MRALLWGASLRGQSFSTELPPAQRPRGPNRKPVNSPLAPRPTRHDRRMHERMAVPSVETRSSWIVATAVLVILAVSFGAPWVTIVALKPVAAELGGMRFVAGLGAPAGWAGLRGRRVALGQFAA